MDKKIDKTIIRAKKRRRILTAAFVTAVIAGGLTALFSKLEKGVDRHDLTIVTVDKGELEITVPASGRVIPAFEEIIISPVTTRVLRIFAQPGDSVSEGSPLLALDLSTEQTTYDKMKDSYNIGLEEQRQQQLAAKTLLSQLEMQIEVKRMEVNRLKLDVINERKLDSLGSGTGERVRQAEAAAIAGELELKQMKQRLVNERKQAEAANSVKSLGNSSISKDLALMEQTLHRATIPAPHDGVLTFIVNEIGATVSTGEKVAVVSDLSRFKIKGEVPERSSDKIGIGSIVSIRLGKTDISGTVTNITPQAKGGVVSFVVNPDDPRHSQLRSGLTVDLFVSHGFKEDVTRLPTGSFFKGRGEYNLFVLDADDHLVKRKVSLGDSNRSFAEVISGLKPGDRVVVSDMERFESKNSLNIKD